MAGVPKPKNDLANLPPMPVKMPVNAAPQKPANRGDGKARSKAQDAVTKAERRVQDAEAQLSEVEKLLASGKAGLDMITLASDYARAQDAVNVAVSGWETASAEWESLA